jgi:hypothetical protein
MSNNERLFEGRSVSLPCGYWKILENIQAGLSEPSVSGVLKGILDQFFAEKTYLEEELGPEKAAAARKALGITA